tara:strand:- start:2042 stop:2269 length:228 start_codon:yes stop_codon:yes gene_type:complete
MAKKWLFDYWDLEDGWMIILLGLFKFAWLKGNQGLGPAISIVLGIFQAELTISLGWRTNETTKIKQDAKTTQVHA